ncbi:hypothetical protein CEXT_449541 [Caerostris extrusa]|uniref:Uncharacterized protein n=1 Tax=Caerostris extrusa TaxID=172846 RepID=A0AAV4Q4E6_CAEEX|nr:hypothetical protein CEXT_449541 [Caerostris extrusa]
MADPLTSWLRNGQAKQSINSYLVSTRPLPIKRGWKGISKGSRPLPQQTIPRRLGSLQVMNAFDAAPEIELYHLQLSQHHLLFSLTPPFFFVEGVPRKGVFYYYGFSVP